MDVDPVFCEITIRRLNISELPARWVGRTAIRLRLRLNTTGNSGAGPDRNHEEERLTQTGPAQEPRQPLRLALTCEELRSSSSRGRGKDYGPRNNSRGALTMHSATEPKRRVRGERRCRRAEILTVHRGLPTFFWRSTGRGGNSLPTLHPTPAIFMRLRAATFLSSLPDSAVVGTVDVSEPSELLLRKVLHAGGESAAEQSESDFHREASLAAHGFSPTAYKEHLGVD